MASIKVSSFQLLPVSLS